MRMLLAVGCLFVAGCGGSFLVPTPTVTSTLESRVLAPVVLVPLTPSPCVRFGGMFCGIE